MLTRSIALWFTKSLWPWGRLTAVSSWRRHHSLKLFWVLWLFLMKCSMKVYLIHKCFVHSPTQHMMSRHFSFCVYVNKKKCLLWHRGYIRIRYKEELSRHVTKMLMATHHGQSHSAGLILKFDVFSFKSRLFVKNYFKLCSLKFSLETLLTLLYFLCKNKV